MKLPGCRVLALALFLLPFAAAAQPLPAPGPMAHVVGDWSFGADGGVSGASTYDAAGARLGLACTEDCINFIETSAPCDENAQLPGTMASSLGEVAIVVECHRLDDHYILIFQPTEAFVTMIAGAPEAVFTIRPATGAPAAYRFSLNGAYDAVYAALAAAVGASEGPPAVPGQ